MKRLFLMLLLSSMSMVGFGQLITLIDPNGDGGFETGTTLAANGWTYAGHASINAWYVGSVAVSSGSRGCYVGQSVADNNGGNGAPTTNHIYRDVTIPAGASQVLLSFKLRYTTSEPLWDRFCVSIYPTSITPTTGSYTPAYPFTGTTGAIPPGVTSKLYENSNVIPSFITINSATAATGNATSGALLNLTAYAGQTIRLCFTFTNADQFGTAGNPAVDEISLTYCQSIPTVAVAPATTTVCGAAPSTMTATGTGNNILDLSSGVVNQVILDANVAGGINTLNTTAIPAGATVTGIAVTVNMSHTWVSDMQINLKAPNGNILNLFNGQGGSGDNLTNTVFSSAGGPNISTGAPPFTGTFSPFATIGAGPTGFISNVATFSSLFSVGNGDWVLAMRDQFSGDVPTLISWSVRITYTTTPAFVWSPTTNLFTDIGLTTPYTGTNLGIVYSGNPSPITYTVTGTTAGCSNTATSVRNVNPSPVLTVTPTSSAACAGTSTTLSSAATMTPVSVASGTINLAVLDGNIAGGTHTLAASVPAGATVTGVSVTINMAHTWVSDMIFNLRAPNGNILNLFNSHGGSADNFTNMVISSSGVTGLGTGAAPFTGTWAPTATVGVGPTGNVSNVSSFANLFSVPTGNWVLAMYDQFGGDAPTLNNWTLTITYTLPITYSWAPTAGLFTDAGLTIPYTGTSITTVFSNPASTTTYTASATAAGCTANTPIVRTVNPFPLAIAGTQTVCATSTTTFSTLSTGGTWSSAAAGTASVNAATGLVGGILAGNTSISYTFATGCGVGRTVTVQAAPNLSNFTSPTATTVCVGSGSVVTVNSTSLGAGSYTAQFTLSGANTGSSTAVLTMGASNGTFTIPSGSLPNSGSTTVTITGIQNALTCVTSPASSNTATFGVNANPNLTNFTSPTATNACGGGSSTVTVNSTSLGAGTYTATFNISGANTSSNNTATLTMGASNGTFTIPAGLLPNIGANTVTITRITNASTCFTNVASSNTAAFNVSANPNITNFTSPSAVNVCLGNATTGQLNSTSMGAGTFTVNYSLSGANVFPGNTSTVTMGATSGTFAIPASVLTASGLTNLTINSVTNAAGCTVNTTISNTASFTMGANAPLHTVTGGGTYCVADGGAVVGLSGSAAGNTYQLYQGTTAVGSPVAGTGAAISFGPQATVGAYTVRATNTSSSCQRGMLDTVDVLAPFTPGTYTLSGGGGYCVGGTGVTINLSSSDNGVFYQLYNGAAPVGSPILGTGAPFSFGVFTASGTYMAIASPGTSCATSQTGTPSVIINPLPTSYSVSGGGNYCAGGSGVAVGLSFGSSGTQYTLYNGAAPVSTVGGTNAALSFGNMTSAGTYTVSATVTATGCSNNMSGSATVGVTALPVAFNVTGGGNYCSGGSGVAVGLAGSASGVSYQLYNGASTVGSPVAGTGAVISFGNQTSTGIYSVLATTSGCSAAMTGTATVIMNATPPVFTTGGSTTYCAGGTGGIVTLNGSTAGVNYQLYIGSSTVGAPVAGTGAALSFGSYTTAGTYTVSATNPATTCTSNMSGSAVININATPTAFTVGGGGGYCTGAIGATVTLSGSQPGVNYQLYRSGIPVGGPVAGSGSNLNFGYQTEEGVYTVVASNLLTGCTATQAGSAVISVNALPTIYPVTGGGNYCAGGTGIAVGVGGSTPGVSYYLYNGATLIGAPVAGTNLPISFGVQTLSGTYTVFALNTTTNCTNNMSGSASIGINPLPTIYPVTGTGSYCAGGTGVAVGLSSSTTGVNYSLFNGSSLVSVIPGTGSPLSFGNMTAAGTYTVQANNATTACTQPMSGNAVVTVNTLPLQHTVNASGSSYCAGGSGITIGLLNSTSGINYQLYNGATAVGLPVAGTNLPISFGLNTAAGTYSVIATNPLTGCTKMMLGDATIAINPLPVAYAVTGGGSYCNGGTGVNIGLSGSEINATYQLYDGAAAIGAAVPGTGTAITFGAQLVGSTYTVVATNTNGCVRNMSGSATVVVNTLPIAQTVTGGGVYCAGTTGVTVGLSSSSTGVNYQLYNGTTAVGSMVAGTNAALSLGVQTATGTYMVSATNATTGCTNNMTGFATVSSNPAPVVYTVTGGGNYCAGGTGVNVMLSGSSSGISYQLMNGTLPVGTAVTGTGAALDFGAQTTAGTYFVAATNGITSCSSTMAGSASVVINPLPTVYAVTGGGNYCSGGVGQHIGLSGSNSGSAYQLYNGSTPVGSLVSGTGLALDFGLKTAGGTYSVIGYNPATTCFSNMLGAAVINVNTLPTVHTVTGGGSYCNGGTGVNIGLSSSTPGASYQLYNGTGTAGTPQLGTGDAIDFGSFTGTGTYSVLATTISTGCTNAMSGTASVSINALPLVHTVAGGGTICQGSAGALVTLNSSNSGINYQLYNGSTPVGAPVPGTGAPISFGNQTAAGTYTVMATNGTTGCVRNMSGAVNVNVNAQPTAYTVTGGGNYCADDNGMAVGLNGSNTGINYQLYLGTTTVGGPIPGNNGTISFGLQTTAGNYTVKATNALTGCTNTMTGSANIGVNALPAVYNVTGGGSYCAGDAGVGVVLSSSTNGISYQLYNGTDPVGTPMIGAGIPVNFGLQTVAGTYMIIATNDLTGCDVYMNGSAAVVVNPLPTQYAVNGGGEYCNGGTGRTIGLFPSNTGISYQLYFGGVAMGSPVAGNGGAISFGPQTVAGAYTVLATNNTTGCTNPMTGGASIIVNDLPTAYNVTGGGSLCAGDAGVAVMLNNSTADIEYQLYNGTTAVGAPVTSVGGAINFGLQTVAGTYKVMATNTITTCTSEMTGAATVIVNALPVAQNVTGGGSYCAGGTGVAVGLNSSATGINYQLMLAGNPVGSIVAGTGDAISFGMQTAAGVYDVAAENTVTGCTNMMNGDATVIVNDLPGNFAVLASASSYCAGDAGVTIFLNGSETGKSYQLFNGTAAAGSAIAGTGTMIDFGPQTAPGMYTVVASDNGTACSATMSGSASVVVNSLPTAFTMTGGGGYCAGTAGAVINLNGSTVGVNYQLYNALGAVGAPVAGTGTPLTFGQHTAGTYVVMATNLSTTCTNTMTGSLVVTENELPFAYPVSGGGQYCAGGAGVVVGILGSAIGVNYQLHNGAALVGGVVAGTGASLSFGSQTAAGTYMVSATNTTTGCTNMMSGDATVVVNALPELHAVIGGGQYCAGGAGMSVGLAGSNTGTNYQLYNGIAPVTGAILAGDGNPLSFGLQTASGNYGVMATSTSNGCSTSMTGTVAVIANALPIAYAVTGGGHYCASATSVGLPVGMSNSDAGINYQLYKDGVATGTVVAGGGAISFGPQTGAGVYTVKATNTTSSCTNTMAGSVTISMSPAVTPAVTVTSSAGTTVCIGVLTTFTAASVNGGSTPAYQWQVNGVNVGLGLSTYQYVPTDEDVVSVTMTSSEVCAAPSTASASVSMTVSSHQMPVANVSVMPNDTICKGTAVTYNVTPSFGGTAPTYRWLKNGVPAGTGTSYTVVPADGDVITCEMTSNFPCRLDDVVSTDVKMNVVEPVDPVVTISANPGLNFAAGQNVRFTASATNAGANPTYKWEINGAAVAGATNSTFMTNTLFDNDEVSCTVVNTSGPCLPTSGTKSVIVNVTSVGVAQVATTSDIRLMPNPNKGDFILKGTTGTTEDKELTIDVTDMLGQVVYTAKIMPRNGNIDEKVQIGNTLANGMYILTLRSDNEKKTFHFVLQQ